ncbi:hypothetical protein J3E68DRAFT_63897 [Trichoderma sp. SZMC 28012]
MLGVFATHALFYLVFCKVISISSKLATLHESTMRWVVSRSQVTTIPRNMMVDHVRTITDIDNEFILYIQSYIISHSASVASWIFSKMLIF